MALTERTRPYELLIRFHQNGEGAPTIAAHQLRIHEILQNGDIISAKELPAEALTPALVSDLVGDHLPTLIAERDDLVQQVATTTDERDALTEQLGAVETERDGLAARLSEVTAERDALAANLSVATSEKDAAAAECAAVTAARDALSAELTALKASLVEAVPAE